MNLEQKKFIFDFDGDFEKSNPQVAINDGDPISPKYFFKDLEVGEDSLCGYSFLQFYTIKDGSLIDKEGNVVVFKVGEKKVPIVKIRDPFLIDADLPVNLQYVKDVSTLLNISEPEKLITALSPAEKKLLIEDREQEYTAKELKKKEEEAKNKVEEDTKAEEERLAEEAKAEEKRLAKEAKAKKEEEEAETARIAEEVRIEEERLAKEEEEIKKAESEHEQKVEDNKIPEGDNIKTPKEYKILLRQRKRMGFDEYTHNNYSFVYGEDRPDNISPELFINRTNYYEMLEGSLVSEDDEEVEYEFTAESGEDKILILKNGKISISEL